MMIATVVLVVLGLAMIIGGYLLPSRDQEMVDPEDIEKTIHDLVQKDVGSFKGQVKEMVEGAAGGVMEKSERALERITNEKMQAISEYSDTVLNEIHKNHEEVVFMFDMLNDKDKSLKETVTEMTRKAKEAQQTVEDAKVSVRQSVQDEKMRQTIQEEKILESLQVLPRTENGKRSDTQALAAAVTKPVYGGRNEEDFDGDLSEESHEEPFDDTAVWFGDVEPTGAYRRAAMERIHSREKEQERLKKSFSPLPELTGGVKNAAAKNQKDSRASGKVVPINMFNQPESGGVVAQESPAMKGLPIHEQILLMHHQGYSNTAIARALSMGVGEVSLVIDLSRKQKKA